MRMRTTDTILGPARGSVLAARDALDRAYPAGAYDDAYIDAEDYIEETYRLAPMVGMDPAILVAQSAHETDSWRSPAWVKWRNPAGLGITYSGQDPGYRWADGIDAARAQVFHMVAYVNPDKELDFPGEWVDQDPRFDEVIRKGWGGTVRTIADLTGKWAEDAREPNDPLTYDEKLVAKGNAIFPGLPAQQQEQPIMARPKVLLIAGHRSYGDAGNPAEKALTPALALDYYAALHDAGYEVWWLQRDVDHDADPDDTVGGLDTVSMVAYNWARTHSGPKVLLDLHYEGSPARGLFAIIPDVTGLRTSVNLTQLATDTWEHNVLDRQLGRAWAKQMQLHTGLPLRTGIREPGLMDESQTGVGGQGFRLATFAYTSPLASEMVRLVLEHGNHTHAEDREIIGRDDFTQRCAAAALAALNEVYGVEPVEPLPGPETNPDAPKHALPPGMSFELARELWRGPGGLYVSEWGEGFDLDLGRAASQVWLARAKRQIPDGGTWESEGVHWPHLIEVIRRGKEGDRGYVYRWSDGSTYWSKPRS